MDNYSPTIPATFELVQGYRGQVISLDEQTVVEHFLGKTRAEAYEMYCSNNNLAYAEDLMWMNVGGLEYYLAPAFQYLQDDRSKEDCSFASNLLSSSLLQLESNKLPPRLVAMIQSVTEYVRHNLTKFVEECDDIYLPHIQQRISDIEANLKK